MARRRKINPDKLRREIGRLEADIAAADDASSIDNCTLHIRYWRLREALASHEHGEATDDDSRKLRWMHLRQASEQTCAWEQRRDHAVRQQVLTRLDEVEALVHAKQSASSKLTKIKT